MSSFDWGKARIAVVAHSFRVMAKARNYDEMVVGIMHHVYASSSSARSLFSCDVDDIYNWKKALDLFVEKQKKLKVNDPDNMPDEVLLDLNMDQSLKTDSARLEEWMAEECRWSSKYRRKLERIGANRTARNVMIYDLEDNLEMLIHPEKFREEESWTMVLPWKNEYGVGVSIGDFQRFTMDNVSVSEEGIPYVHYLPEKTKGTQKDNSEVITPLVRYAFDIIRKTEFNLPILKYPSGKSGYNKKIKLLLKDAGLDRKVTKFDEEEGTNKYIPLYESSSSKLARATHVDMMAKVQINMYAAGLHRLGSGAVTHYTMLELADRFKLMNLAFDQEDYRVNNNLEIIDSPVEKDS